MVSFYIYLMTKEVERVLIVYLPAVLLLGGMTLHVLPIFLKRIVIHILLLSFKSLLYCRY